MSECIHPYFIQNGEIRNAENFKLGYINEGKSIYEVTRLAGNGVMFLEDHIDRFFTSLRMEGLTPYYSREDIRKNISELIRKNPASEGNIKFVHNTSPEQEENFLVYFTAHRYPSEKEYREGVKVITYEFERIDPNKKVWRPVFRNNVAREIKQHSAWEALLLDTNGNIPEASRSNLFAIKQGRVITSPDEYILTGITRKHVIQACIDLQIPIDFRLINIRELANMEALFLTSTSLQLIRIRRVDDLKIPMNESLCDRIRSRFEIIKENHLKQFNKL